MKLVQSMLLALLYTAHIAHALDEQSYRLSSMGADLASFVDDTYTDVMRNPAFINKVGERWILTNLSNLSGNNHRMLNYGANTYTGSGGSFMCGMLLPMQGTLKLGILADYWTDGSRMNSGYAMSSETAQSFGWNFSGTDAGKSVIDMNAGTPSTFDDYRIIREYEGERILDRNGGFDLRLLAGSGSLGFAYGLSMQRSSRPSVQTGTRSDLAFSSHSFFRTEQGGGALEAFEVEQQEENEGSRLLQTHSLEAGLKGTLGPNTECDGGAGLAVIISTDHGTGRRKKEMDYDPDMDGVSASGIFDSYTYYGETAFDDDSWGIGGGFGGRIDHRLDDAVRLRIVAEAAYMPLFGGGYELHDSTLQITRIQGSPSTSAYTSDMTTGDWIAHTVTGLAGCGTEVTPATGLVVGAGIKCRYTYSYRYEDLHHENALSGTDGNAENALTATSLRVSLPVGLEYTFGKRYAARIGATSSLTRERTIDETRELDTSGSDYEEAYSIADDVIFSNAVAYSYGFGMALGNAATLDIAGITNLVDISTLFLSLILAY